MIEPDWAYRDAPGVTFFLAAARRTARKEKIPPSLGVFSFWELDHSDHGDFHHLMKPPDQVVFLYPDLDDGAVGRPDKILQVRVFGQAVRPGLATAFLTISCIVIIRRMRLMHKIRLGISACLLG